MARRTFNYYLVKIVRISGWILLPAVLTYIGTGFTMCGKFGRVSASLKHTSEIIHKTFAWPLLVVFLTHSIVAVYLAIRRWGWIGKRKKAQPPQAAPLSKTEA